jgi:hypothetical protein
MNCPRVEIEVVCEAHHGSGRLVVRRDGTRILLDAHADHCCVDYPPQLLTARCGTCCR